MSLILKRYPDLSPPHFFYGGTERLRFSKKNWLWLKEEENGDLIPLSGCTNTTHIIDKSAALMPWAVKMALRRTFEKLQEHRRGDGFYEIYWTELEEILESAKKADKDALEDAGDVGHIAHAWIEDLIKSIIAGDEKRRLEILAKLPEDERAANACIAAVEFMVRHNVRWVATERFVYSREFKYAGTMDGLALVDSCDDPLCCGHPFRDRLSIIDWKTSNYLYTAFLLQVAAYWHAFVEETGEPVEDRWIIRLGKEDGEFDPWHAEGQALFEQDFAAFRHAQNLVLSLKAIEGRISDVRDARREYKKKQREAEKLARDKVRCPKADDYKGSRMTKCLPDGSQCEACRGIYLTKHPEASHESKQLEEATGPQGSEGHAETTTAGCSGATGEDTQVSRTGPHPRRE